MTGVRRRLGFRGRCLMRIGLLMAGYGLTLHLGRVELSSPTASLGLVMDPISPSAWAIVWLMVGLLCVGQAFAPGPPHDRPAFVAATSLFALWALSFASGGSARSIAVGFVFALVGSLVDVIGGQPEVAR